MNGKELKVINKLDKIDIIIDYIFLKQSSVENACNLFPISINEIKKEIDKILSHKDDFIISIEYNGNVIGIGVFFNEPNDKYLECLGCFFNDESDFQLMIYYLREKYKGNHIDFVFPLENINVLKYLKNANGKFYEPEICMEVVLDAFIRKSYSYNVYELSKDYYDSYSKIHNDQDAYWTARRVIKAPKIFKVFVISVNEKIIGYIDVTYGKELVEIYNLNVENNNTEYMGALINVAATNVLNEKNKLIVLIDYDDKEIINLYARFGFKRKNTNQTVAINL